MPQTPSLPQPKSAVADFGHFVEWPNPRYSEVRLGRGRGWGFEPVCTPVPLGTTPHPDPPPAETAYTRVSGGQGSADSAPREQILRPCRLLAACDQPWPCEPLAAAG